MKPPLTPGRLTAALAVAAEIYGVPPVVLLGRGRETHVTRARHMVWAALYQACDGTISQIARAFGRDHTTVLYGIRVAMARAVEDPAVALDLAQIAAEAAMPVQLLGVA